MELKEGKIYEVFGSGPKKMEKIIKGDFGTDYYMRSPGSSVSVWVPLRDIVQEANYDYLFPYCVGYHETMEINAELKRWADKAEKERNE